MVKNYGREDQTGRGSTMNERSHLQVETSSSKEKGLLLPLFLVEDLEIPQAEDVVVAVVLVVAVAVVLVADSLTGAKDLTRNQVKKKEKAQKGKKNGLETSDNGEEPKKKIKKEKTKEPVPRFGAKAELVFGETDPDALLKLALKKHFKRISTVSVFQNFAFLKFKSATAAKAAIAKGKFEINSVEVIAVPRKNKSEKEVFLKAHNKPIICQLIKPLFPGIVSISNFLSNGLKMRFETAALAETAIANEAQKVGSTLIVPIVWTLEHVNQLNKELSAPKEE